MNSGSEDISNEKRIFGRFSREECGLPPVNWGRSGRLSLLIRTVVLLVGLIAAGWIGGILAGRYREAWVATLPGRVRAAEAGELPQLLGRGRVYSISQPGRKAMAASLAYAAMVAAERSPRRMGYYGNASRLLARLEQTDSLPPEHAYSIGLLAADAHAETGDYAGAFASLAKADAALDRMDDTPERRGRRLFLVNGQAYFLATAPQGAGRNPEKALHLAQLMITSRDELPGGGYASGSAALVDTLAAAWHAVGDRERALEAQAFALGLAESQGLDVYVKHYDQYVLHKE